MTIAIAQSPSREPIVRTQDLPGRAERSKAIKRAELAMGVLLTGTVVALLLVRSWHAGNLWRDECGALNLALLPSYTEIVHYFPHEAFPLLFPAVIRAYTSLFGASDTMLRCFGLLVGLSLVGAAWWVARLNRGGFPFVSLSLVGLNATFLVWGTSIRGYGLGSVLIVLAFGLIARLICGFSWKRLLLALLTCVASVHSLLHNSILLFVICLAAGFVCLLQRRFKELAATLAIGGLSAVSLLPYIGPYAGANAWDVVVTAPTSFSSLWEEFPPALGEPVSLAASLWLLLMAAVIAFSAVRLVRMRHDDQAGVIAFATLVLVGALPGYYLFLRILSYPTRAWYYLAVIAFMGVAVDLLVNILCTTRWWRIIRLGLTLLAVVSFTAASWPKVIERQSNIGFVTQRLGETASPNDLIVTTAWQYGVSFARYYKGNTPWITLPVLQDHRFHRYDLFKERMMSPSPIDDALTEIAQRLRSGKRIWLVGGLRILPPGQLPTRLPPASARHGWNNVAYMQSMKEQLGAFLGQHATYGALVDLPATGPVNDLENLPLVFVAGWKD